MIRILYVDDEEILLQLCKSFLESYGTMEVNTCVSVADADQSLSSTHYDAVISDYQMPGADGIDFLKMLRSHGNRIPFILFTGKGREEVAIEALNEGADFYIQKGGDPEAMFLELEHKVRAAVQRREAEEAVIRSNLMLKAAMDLTHIAYWSIDLEAMVLHVDDGFWAVLGTDGQKENGNETSVDKFLSEFVHPDDRHKLLSNLEIYRSAVAPKTLQYDYRIIKRNGEVRHVNVISMVVTDAESKKVTINGAVQDITDLKSKEDRLAKLNRELLAIKKINQLIVHAKTEKELLDNTCSIVCEIGGYLMAWIGKLENDAHRSIRPVAWAGVGEQYVLNATVSWGDNERGKGPTGVAARTGRTTYVQDWEKDAGMSAWRSEGQRYGYRSSICLPIISQGKVIALLSLYSGTINGFTQDEIQMLEEMAGDLAFGISSLRGEREKVRTEDELLKKSALFEAQTAASFDGILVVDPDFKRIMMNRRIIELFDPPQRVLDNPDDDRLLLDHVLGLVKYPDKFLQKVNYLNEHPEETSWDEIELKNGIILERYSAPVIGKGGRHYGRTWIFRDVSERKHMEDSLRESEDKFRSIFNSTNDGIYIVDHDKRFIEVNQTFAERLGYSRDEMVQMALPQIVLPEYHHMMDQMFNGTMKGGHQIFDSVHVTKDGRNIPVEINTHNINYQGRSVYLGVARDITERKISQQELRRKSEEIEAFFDLGLDLLGILDLEGNFIRINKGWEEALGYAEEEFRTLNFWNLIHPDDLAATREVAQNLVDNKLVINFVNRYRKKGGEYCWIEWYAAPREGVIFTAARNITETKQAQDALAEANRKLKILSSITRHDISNLVMAQTGFLNLWAKKNPNCVMDDNLKRVRDAAKSIESAIQFTKLYEEIGVRAPIWQDLKGVIDKSLGEVQLGNVKAINEIPNGTEVFADSLISKVFYNLAFNAVQHGGKTTAIRIFAEEANDGQVIVFQDDGQGISQEARRRLFTHMAGEEHGFGLYLSKEILAITGIAIRENGKPGEGARFEILIPSKGWRQSPGPSHK